MKVTSAAAALTAMVVSPAVAFMPSSISTKVVYDSCTGSVDCRRILSSRPEARPVRSFREAEKVETEVVGVGSETKGATAAKTEELIDSAKEAYISIANAIKDFDSRKFQDDVEALGEGIKTNTQAGVSGERGEVWTAAQLVILLLVLLGNLPILGSSLEFFAGPGFLLLGAGLAVASSVQLGKTFSLWPEPADGSVLNTTGAYSLSRHPMYTGLVMFSLGLGFSTGSFTRIALACLLGYVLDRQADLEEERLMDIHPAYKTYKEEVSKFLPSVY